MVTVLEDRYIGRSGSPALRQGFIWEPSKRRVRAVFADETIADSKNVMLMVEYGYLPVFYFPIADLRMDLLQPTDHHTNSPLKGEASYFTVRVGDRVAENAAWTYPDPTPDAPPIAGYAAFYWTKMDAWYEEDERVYGHARDPYKRVDILPSSRHVRVVLGGETIAETRRPKLLLETGLVTRFYIPPEDVRMDLLEPTQTATRCPYKGRATYWTARIGGQIHEDIVWSYQDPLPECSKVRGDLCFYNERVDAIYVDDELLSRPETGLPKPSGRAE